VPARMKKNYYGDGTALNIPIFFRFFELPPTGLYCKLKIRKAQFDI
jgi:hypothetical protein